MLLRIWVRQSRGWISLQRTMERLKLRYRSWRWVKVDLKRQRTWVFRLISSPQSITQVSFLPFQRTHSVQEDSRRHRLILERPHLSQVNSVRKRSEIMTNTFKSNLNMCIEVWIPHLIYSHLISVRNMHLILTHSKAPSVTCMTV